MLFADAAFALGGEDGHLTVSLDKLRHHSVSGNTATFGAGNRLGDVALYLWDNGQLISICGVYIHDNAAASFRPSKL